MKRFTLSMILSHFGYEQNILVCNPELPTMSFLGANIYQPDTELFRHCLYIVEGDRIPAPLLSGYYACIVVTSSPAAFHGPYATETVVWPVSITGDMLLIQIQNLFLSGSSQAHMAHMLMNSLSVSANIKSIILQAATIMQNAIILMDPAYQVIAMEGLGHEINDIFWQDCVRYHRVSDSNIRLLKDTGMLKDLEQSSSIMLWQNASHFNNIPRLAQKIYSNNGAYLGTIAVFQCCHPFSIDDYYLLDSLVNTLSVILENHAVHVNPRPTGSSLLTALLTDASLPLSPENSVLKADLEKHSLYQAGFISLSGEPSIARLGLYLQSSLLSEQACILSTLSEKNLTLLIYYDDIKESRDMYAWLQKKLSPLGIALGLSYIFSNLDSFCHQAKLAMNAFFIGSKHFPGNCLHLYSQTAHLPLLDTISKPFLQDYVKDSPPAILQSEHHPELYRTLKCFIRHQGSYVDTAQELFIHKNTLLYRLSKIQALTGIDYSSPDDIWSAAHAFRVLDYLRAAGSHETDIRRESRQHTGARVGRIEEADK